MSSWIYFIHPTRDNFAATMTEAEHEVWHRHSVRLQELLEQGTVLLAGPTLGVANMGIIIFDAPDEDAAREIMMGDPVIGEGWSTGELRAFQVSYLRGRPKPSRSA